MRHAPQETPPGGPDELTLIARQQYVAGRIELDEFERALEHILRGGLGTPEFPYLPVFRMPHMDRRPA